MDLFFIVFTIQQRMPHFEYRRAVNVIEDFFFCVLLSRIAALAIEAAYCYRPSSVVCLPVCHTSETCKQS